jgi:hypothetical protein
VPDFEPRARLPPCLSLFDLSYCLVDLVPYLSPLVSYLFTARSTYSSIVHFLLIPARAHPPHASNATCPMHSCPRLARTCFSFLSSFVFPLRHALLRSYYTGYVVQRLLHVYRPLCCARNVIIVLFFFLCVCTVVLLLRLLPRVFILDLGLSFRSPWVSLGRKGTQRGDIYLKLTFFFRPCPTESPPIQVQESHGATWATATARCCHYLAIGWGRQTQQH